MKILELSNVSKWFGGIKAVDGVSLSIEESSVIGLIGPNASGKTTLFNVIAGLYKPRTGEIYFRGERIDGLTPHEIFKKGLVKTYQSSSLFPSLTVSENLLLSPKNQIGEKVRYAIFHNKWRSQEIDLAKQAKGLINFLELDQVHENLADALSGGQMKLCELARAFMGNASLLLLDEPTAGVAPHLAGNILKRIKQFRELYNITFFIIEHRLGLLLDYVDYVYVMDRGKIIKKGKPDEVVKDPLVREVYLGDYAQ